MSAESSQRLIEELSRDLKPVRRIPPLRLLALAVAMAAGAVALAVLGSGGVRSDLAGLLPESRTFTAMLVGLAMAAVGGPIAALAEGTPGRERTARLGTAVLLLGLGWAGGSAFAAWWASDFAAGVSFAADRMCFRSAVTFALLPSAALLVIVLRGWVARPLPAAALTLAGGVACGAVIVHLSCSVDGARHLLLGHVLPPVAIALVAGVPLAAWLRRRAR